MIKVPNLDFKNPLTLVKLFQKMDPKNKNQGDNQETETKPKLEKMESHLKKRKKRQSPLLKKVKVKIMLLREKVQRKKLIVEEVAAEEVENQKLKAKKHLVRNKHLKHLIKLNHNKTKNQTQKEREETVVEIVEAVATTEVDKEKTVKK